MDDLRPRLETFESQLHALQEQTQTVTRQLRWWRGLAGSLLVLAVLTWALPLGTVQEDSMAGHEKGTKGLEERVAALERLLKHFKRDGNEITIKGANLHIVNGLGSTDCFDEQFEPIPDCPNGLGNLIVGYNELRGEGDVRTGSHNVVVGQQHNFSRFGGLVVGRFNEISGDFAVVSGGFGNTASGFLSSVSGGSANTASGEASVVSGGNSNIASGDFAAVSGGAGNTASGLSSSVNGGTEHTASGGGSSVSGGARNTANGGWSSVSGGARNTASGDFAAVSGGGFDPNAEEGAGNTASGNFSSVSGGRNRTAAGDFDWVAGDLFQDE